MKTDTKTAEERELDVFEEMDALLRYSPHKEVDNQVEHACELLKAHAAEARREALREAADVINARAATIREVKADISRGYDAENVAWHLRNELLIMTKAIEQLGDSDHE